MSSQTRLPHILPPRELVRLLLPTYLDAVSVDDGEAQSRLDDALGDLDLRADLMNAIEAALRELRGARTGEDQQLDKISKGLAKHHTFKPAPGSPALSAVLVAIDLAAGLGEGLHEALKSEKGKALYQAGLLVLGRHLAKELSR